MRVLLHTFKLSILLAASSTTLAAPAIRVALGENKPPYIMQEAHAGIEYELITTTLKRAGFQVEAQHMPNKRALNLFASGKIDATIVADGAIVSEPYIAYKNMAVTLCEKNIRLEHVNDLRQYQVATFHNASQLLGTDFARAVADDSRYSEVSPQYLLNRMLAAGRIQVAISDINIFKHFNQALDSQERRTLCPYALFSPTRYRLAFRNSANRDRFNTALHELREAGFYEQLAQKYALLLENERPYFKP
ncbi:substrate-binding periplasmic protein [Chitinibacter sp. S2-10]|uniref:substrate-binding periplasmic protein n=1 Tax=Chitinibacter sp. S2-10 TaxID=3373597 RepID=UPI0039779013